ncbi:MAG: 2-oxoacid:acceptor oxidoreductase family protein [Roseburia sp.]|nr:2-oxoacid:acceptor oxidoreductase family protein [Roseburia sp.]
MADKFTLPITKESGYFEIRLESIGGLGANLCGKMLGELGALYLKLNSTSFSSYGSEKRGSPVKSHIRWCAPEKFLRLCTPVIEPNILGIFHEALLKNYPLTSDCTEHTCILLNTSLSREEVAETYHISHGRLFCIPALDIALEEKSRINMVMLGAITAVLGFVPLEMAEELCRNTIGKKYPQLIDANLNGLRRGYEHIKEQRPLICSEDISSKSENQTSSAFSYTWGYKNAPIGGINPRIGSTVSNDLSASREGYIPLFIKDRCINCGLCDSTCPDFVFQFMPGIYKEKECMVNMGPDYTHCKGCLRCVEVCPTNALVTALEKDYPEKPFDQPNKNLLTNQFAYTKHGADASITGESYLTERYH